MADVTRRSFLAGTAVAFAGSTMTVAASDVGMPSEAVAEPLPPIDRSPLPYWRQYSGYEILQARGEDIISAADFEWKQGDLR